SRSPPPVRRRISSGPSPAIQSCAGCSTRFRAGSSTRSPRFERSLTRCSTLATETKSPTLTEIEAARRGLAGVAPATPVYGAATELAGLTFEEALAAALAYAEETGATFVHPYEDETVIAGQGTIGLELAEQVPQAETVLVPVGGGGLAAGIALALRAVRPE